eukprot:2976253-Pleurochrysis_carterae.AAC.1
MHDQPARPIKPTEKALNELHKPAHPISLSVPNAPIGTSSFPRTKSSENKPSCIRKSSSQPAERELVMHVLVKL